MKRKFAETGGNEQPDRSEDHSPASTQGGESTRPHTTSPPSFVALHTPTIAIPPPPNTSAHRPPPPTSHPPAIAAPAFPLFPPQISPPHGIPLIGLPIHPIPRGPLAIMSEPPSPSPGAVAAAVPRPPPNQLPPFRRILVVNPNRSVEMTNTIRGMVRPPPGTMVQYYTSADGPPSIDGARTSVQSTMAALHPLIAGNALSGHDGFLVACYSAHPLVECLREMTSKPVMGIFQASIFWALSLGGRFGIVTTNQRWDYILTKSVHDLIGSNPAFARVICTGYTAAEVHGEPNRNQVQRAMAEAAQKLVKEDHCDIIILGCAGMTGLEETIREAVGQNVTIIDGVVAGVHMLAGLIHAGQQTSQAGVYGL
jgi:Asp/Glu/hydantoin racemase